MSISNYATDIIEQMAKELNNSGYQLFDETRLLVKRHIPNAIKFRLPDKGWVFGIPRDSSMPLAEKLNTFAPEQRLPYDIMSIEYFVPQNGRNKEFDAFLDGCGEPSNYDATLVLLIQEASTITGIPVFRFNENSGNKFWSVSNFGFVLNLENKTYMPIPMTEPGAKLLKSNPGVAINDVVGEATATAELLCACACSNIKIKDDENPISKLNKKRIKKGKAPFYSYKTLLVEQKAVSKKKKQGGTHTSPRVHLRRGHIRRLPNKTVWVNASVVGDKSKGMINKDYKVKEIST